MRWEARTLSRLTCRMGRAKSLAIAEKKMNESFISDLTIYKLSPRFRGIFSFYESSSDWHRDFNRCGFYSKEGAKSFFEVVNGPWPRAKIEIYPKGEDR